MHITRGVGTDFGLGRQQKILGDKFFCTNCLSPRDRELSLKYWVDSCQCLPRLLESDAPAYNAYVLYYVCIQASRIAGMWYFLRDWQDFEKFNNCPLRVLFYLDYKQSILVELCKNSYFSKEKRTIEIGIPLKDEKNFSWFRCWIKN